MLRDVFYYGKKPNVHPREQFAESLEDARQKATTRDFWIINEFCDYKNFDWDFDFEFLPDEDVWAEDHNNVWPSQWQKDSGTWLCPKEHSDVIIYRGDVDPVIRKNEKQSDNWLELDLIDHTKFDFSWHPDPTDPPYIYKWGCKYFPAEIKHVLEYHVPGATQEKYMNTVVELLPDWDKWTIPTSVDKHRFDFRWRPSPLDPPFIYEFGTQWQRNGGPIYTVNGATVKKYTNEQKATRLPSMDNWEIPNGLVIDTTKFDFSWHPDNTAQPYIYQFDTQWSLRGGPRYVVPGATEISYVEDIIAYTGPCMDNWEYDETLIDGNSFDFSWHPYVDEDQPYIYQFGTQWQKTGGPRYIMPGATQIKYIDTRVNKATRLPNSADSNWNILLPVKDFDYSWHPDDTEEPYIYRFGNNLYPAEDCATIEYLVPGATQIKYVADINATLDINMDNWVVPDNVATSEFDFSWMPNPNDPPYIYEFGTQWQNTGGPKYVVPGATEKKYIDFQTATRLPSMDRWHVPSNIDKELFDFSWHANDTSPPYIYVFATQWAFSGGPVFTVPGATEIKYIDDQVATALPDKTNWIYDETKIDVESFDFSWHPHVEDQPYVYQFGTQWQKTGGPRYISPGADDSSSVKYIDTRILKATRLPSMDNWEIPTGLIIDTVKFDFSWHPDDLAPAYIYQFDTQWSLRGGPRYVVPGATEISYVEDIIAYAGPCMDNWVYDESEIDVDSFDFSWHPYTDEDKPYIYQFGTQWQKTGGPRYIVPGAEQVKYVDTRIIKATRLPDMKNWTIPDNVTAWDFDFSWHPDDTMPPYIYKFGTQWAMTGGPVYTVPGATEVSYVEDMIVTAGPCMDNWEVPDDIAVEEFDFSWHPYAEDDPFIYQFGTQWQKTGGPRYIVPGATQVKYVDTRILKARRLPNRSAFTVLGGANIKHFDWSWHPDDTSPPYLYQFGNNWYSAEEMPTIEYRVQGATEAKFVNDIIATLAPNKTNWTIPEGVDVSNFDFSWVPYPSATPYVYRFGTSTDPNGGPIYNTPGNTGEIVYLPRIEVADSSLQETVVEEVEEVVTEELPTLNETMDMFFVDKGNSESAARFEALKARFGTKIQKTRYLNSWVDTINRCVNRATSPLIWILNSELDYNEFEFNYYPNQWQMKMVHVFGTQWSHWGTTFLVNRETFPNDTKWIKIIEHLSNINFVKNMRATATTCLYDILMINHGNNESRRVEETLKSITGHTVNVVEYEESYLNTIRKYVKKLPEKKEHYLWICSSVCDYSKFDFSYICDPYSRENLHVFPSGIQKFGDTFLIDVNKTKEIIDDLERLEDYDKVNYTGTVKAERLPEPIIVTTDDTHVNVVKNITGFPYATVVTQDNISIESSTVEPMNLWSPETKNIIVTSTGATRIIVPAEAKDYVQKELYDYPYIKRSPKLLKSNPLDIVFLSNGEIGADENYEHLLNVTENLPNRVVRVDGINGRVAAYHAAAETSETPWFFTVFAKLKVSHKFDWNWQPDRMQSPKHYIFHAKNPVNGLIYGHQAMIAYNKKLTLNNEGRGLDFTLDDEHEVVPLISGTANYNTDEFSTWRTAFREVIKLKADHTDVAKERLEAWLNKAEGEFAQYSIKGAVDAEEYFDEVDGDFEMLKLSYEWDWLKQKFNDV